MADAPKKPARKRTRKAAPKKAAPKAVEPVPVAEEIPAPVEAEKMTRSEAKALLKAGKAAASAALRDSADHIRIGSFDAALQSLAVAAEMVTQAKVAGEVLK